jgi:hypothetical protein
VRRDGLTGDAARFAREWNVAFLLVAGVGGALVAVGQTVAGAVAFALCAAAVLARWHATRKQGRGFYGQEKRRHRNGTGKEMA